MSRPAGDKKFFDLEVHDLHAIAIGVVAPPKADAAVGDGEQPVVGERDAVGVAAEVGEHMFRPGERRLAVDDPRLLAERGEPGGKRSCRARSSASKSWAGFVRRRSGPRTGGGLRCASTSTLGSAPTGLPDPERAASGPEAPRSPCSSLGDEPTRPPRGYVGFVGDSRTGAAELRALLEAGEKRRKEQAGEARKLRRRQIIQRVKDRVVGQFWSPGRSIPAETKALALKEIERDLSVLPLDELPEWELVQIAEGARDRVCGAVMRAQDEAQRLAEQRRREVQEAARRAVEQRAREAHEREEREEHIAALRRYGMALARDAVQHVEDLDQGERRSLLQRVERELAELTGEESEREVTACVGEILDAELAEPEADDEDDGYEDEYEEEDDEDDDEDDEDGEDEDDE